MDLVNNLVRTIGNIFIKLGILVSAEVKAEADSLIEVKYCNDLILSPPDKFCSGCKAISLATPAEQREVTDETQVRSCKGGGRA